MAQYLNVGKALKCYKCVSLSDPCVADRNVKGTEVDCGNATSQTCMKIQGSKLNHSNAWILVIIMILKNGRIYKCCTMYVNSRNVGS